MSTVLLVISAILLISTFGIHMVIKSDIIGQPMYLSNPFLSAIPWISAFVLAVIAWANVIEWHWLLLFIINLVVVFALGPAITKGFLVRFASGKGLGRDMFTSFVLGVILLIVGLVIKS